MKNLQTKINPKIIGICMMTANILMLIGSLLFLLLIIGSTSAYGVGWLSLAALFSYLFVILSISMLYPSVRYIKNKPFKQNRIIGIILITLALINLFRTTKMVMEINPGGEGQIVIAGVIGVYFIFWGFGLFFGFKKS